MAKEVRLRRGTTAEHQSFTGAEGELTVNTDNYSLVLHDGETPGGRPVGTSGVITTDNFVGDGTTGPFTLSRAPGIKANVLVLLNGVIQATDAYDVSGTDLTFTENTPEDAVIQARVISAFSNLAAPVDYGVQLYNSAGTVIATGGYVATRFAALPHGFGHFYAEVTHGQSGDQVAVSVYVNDVLEYGPVTVTYGTPEDDAAFDVVIERGDKIVFQIEPVTGTPWGFYAQFD